MLRRLQTTFRSIPAKTIPTAFSRNYALHALPILVLRSLSLPYPPMYWRVLTSWVITLGQVTCDRRGSSQHAHSCPAPVPSKIGWPLTGKIVEKKNRSSRNFFPPCRSEAAHPHVVPLIERKTLFLAFIRPFTVSTFASARIDVSTPSGNLSVTSLMYVDVEAGGYVTAPCDVPFLNPAVAGVFRHPRLAGGRGRR